MEVKSGR